MYTVNTIAGIGYWTPALNFAIHVVAAAVGRQ
jgi:hypothetical protein